LVTRSKSGGRKKTPLAYHTCTDEEMDLYNHPVISSFKTMKCLDKKDLFGHDLDILLERGRGKNIELHLEYRFVGELTDENRLAKF